MNDSAGFSSLAFGCTWFREVCSGVIFCMRSANWIVCPHQQLTGVGDRRGCTWRSVANGQSCET